MFSVSSFEECFVQDCVTSPLLNPHPYQSSHLLNEFPLRICEADGPVVDYITLPLFSERLAINARSSSSERLLTGHFRHAEAIKTGGGLSRKE
jgi:hypothetical protein